MNMALYFYEFNKRKKLMKEIDTFLEQYDNLVKEYNYFGSENEELVLPTKEVSNLIREFEKVVKEH